MLDDAHVFLFPGHARIFLVVDAAKVELAAYYGAESKESRDAGRTEYTFLVNQSIHPFRTVFKYFVALVYDR
jgi:hypothetical protein